MKNSFRKIIFIRLLFLVCFISNNIYIQAQNCNLVAGFTYTLLPNGVLNLSSTSTGTNTNTQYYWKTNSYNYQSYNNPIYSNPATFSFIANSVVNMTLVVSSPFNLTPFCTDSIVQTISINNVTCSVMGSFTLQRDTTQLRTWNLIPTFPANLVGVTWNWGDGTISNSLFPSHTYSSSGFYGIQMTTSVSCNPYAHTTSIYTFLNRPSKEENGQAVTVNVINGIWTDLKVSKNDNQQFSIFPNPNNSSFSLQLNDFEKGKEVNLSITNLLGEEIYTVTFLINEGVETKKLELSEAKSGTYFVKLHDGEKVKVTKLLIVK